MCRLSSHYGEASQASPPSRWGPCQTVLPAALRVTSSCVSTCAHFTSLFLASGSSIHGCNICGKEGHQAAHCPNGTVGWETKWPKEAFQLEEAQWYAEPNYDVVAKVAREWADKRRRQLAAGAAIGEEATPAAETAPGDDSVAVHANGDSVQDGAGAQQQVPPVPAAPGNQWQTFYDGQGRPYYFHAATNTTAWALPPGAVALPGVPPPGVTPQAALQSAQPVGAS